MNRLTAFRIYAFAIALIPFVMAARLLLFANQPTSIKLIGAFPCLLAGSWLLWSGRRRGNRIAQRLQDADRGHRRGGE